MQAVHALGQWPFLLRPFVHWFLPEVRTIKGEVARARQILEPVIRKRREANEVAKANGEKTSKVADTIGWLDDMFKGEQHDAALMQLGLSFAAIHTTSELVSGIMADLCNNPEWFGPLREEMVASIKEHGWSKKALQAITLTDSLMKESQRHHFIDVGGYNLSGMFGLPLTLSQPPCAVSHPSRSSFLTGLASQRAHSPWFP